MSPQINYHIKPGNPASKLIQIELLIEGNQSNELQLCLPVWRPGRYEIGNFAKNILQVEALDKSGNKLSCQKISSHTWQINTGGSNSIRICYSYYAAELNAGSSYLDDRQLYINPVNCCMYIPERMHEPCGVYLDVPDTWEIATALPVVNENREFRADSFDMLADSPLIASDHLQHQKFTLSEHLFYVWFCGEVNPNWPQLLEDFKAFIQVQIDMMGSLPVKEYHFLFQVLPQPFYHGVEHLASTVCALGPGYKLFDRSVYKELLGVSSHELFHTWNIKYIRPSEMLPYDFSKENYSRMGWIYEGITTYYGDQFLIRSAVFSPDEFLETLNDKLKKHFTSYGRFNQAVTEASFDTWLDGYVPGIPHRKTSIYTEGSLAAFIFDMKIRDLSADRFSLDDFMRALLQEATAGKGYDRKMVINLLSSLCGTDMEPLYRLLVESASDLDELLAWAGNRVGLELEIAEPFSATEHGFGFLLTEGSTEQVKLVAAGSPAEEAGLSAGDQIVACNGFRNRKQLLFSGTEATPLLLHIFSGDSLREICLEKSTTRYFQSRKFKIINNTEEEQKLAWENWAGTPYPLN